jgi:hypothetical protein
MNTHKSPLITLLAVILIVLTNTFSNSQTPLDPGRYDDSWWNRAPYRLVQTNLREIDATMDTDAYVQSMVDASVTVVLLNVGGIVANYPTKLPFHFRNPYMNGDLVGELVNKLHDKGIRVIGRFDFSKLNETLAEKKPGWLYVSTGGKHVNYNGQVHTCINGGYQQEYSKEILTEALGTYPLDGVFFNMIGYTTSDYSGVNHGICQCENCSKRFYDSTGHRLPARADPADPVYREYNEFKRSTADKLFREIGQHIKDLKPKVMINTYADAGVDMIASESGASLSSAYEWNYSATDNVKRILGSYNDRAPGNLLIYFQDIGFRHVGTSPNLARVWMLENMLHGAPLGFVVIGTLVNYEDRIFIPTLNDLYGFHKSNEKLFTNLQSVSKVGLIRGAGEEYRGMIKLLSEEHIMFDVIEPATAGTERTPRKLGEYSVLILPHLEDMDDRLISVVDDYVRNGGKILATGATSTRDESGKPTNSIRLKALGVMPEYGNFKQAKSTYLKVSENDKTWFGETLFKDFSIMMMYSDFLKCKPTANATGLLRLVPETRFGPPEKSYFTDENISDTPGVIVNNFGQGKSVFIPWQIGSLYYFKGNYMHRALFAGALGNILKVNRTIITNASPLMEISHMANRNNAFEWIGIINHSGQIGGSMREPVEMHNIMIRFKPVKSIKEIRLMRTRKKIPFKEGGGWVECTVPQVNDFEMVVCYYKK